MNPEPRQTRSATRRLMSMKQSDETPKAKRQRMTPSLDRSAPFLPPEIMGIIFDHLKTADLQKCAQVCTQWNDIANEEIAKKAVAESYLPYFIEGISRFSHFSAWLKNQNVSFSCGTNWLSSVEDMESLLKTNRRNPIPHRVVVFCIEEVKNLIDFENGFLRIFNEFVERFGNIIWTCYLILPVGQCWRKECEQLIVRSLLGFKQLRSFTVFREHWEDMFKDPGSLDISTSLDHLSNLKTVQMLGMNARVAFNRLFSTLDYKNKIENLRLGSDNIWGTNNNWGCVPVKFCDADFIPFYKLVPNLKRLTLENPSLESCRLLPPPPAVGDASSSRPFMLEEFSYFFTAEPIGQRECVCYYNFVLIAWAFVNLEKHAATLKKLTFYIEWSHMKEVDIWHHIHIIKTKSVDGNPNVKFDNVSEINIYRFHPALVGLLMDKCPNLQHVFCNELGGSKDKRSRDIDSDFQNLLNFVPHIPRRVNVSVESIKLVATFMKDGTY